jgi:hypothetical protein
MKQILVLRTSLAARSDVEKVAVFLDTHIQIIEWNVDLEDCDKVLRIECLGLTEADMVEILNWAGYEAEKLY